MKRTFILLFTITIICKAFGQSTMSDNYVPIPIPPTTDTPSKCTPAKKLLSFTLPCCVEKKTYVSSIAQVKFSETACPEPSITYNPAELTPSSTSGNTSQTVTATADDVTLTATISVVNPDVSFGFTPIQFSFQSEAERLQNEMEAFLNKGVSPCKPSGSLVPSASLGYESSNMCCTESPCVKISKKYSGAASWSYGMTCHFPVYGIPYVASIDAVLSANASLALSISHQTTCTNGKACVGLNATVTIGGGLGFTIGHGALSGDLQITGSGGYSGTWCFHPTVEAPEGKWSIGAVKLVGNVSAGWGLTSKSVEITLFSGW